MGIRLWEHISSKALIRYDKHIVLDIPCTFREENKDMAQTRKLDGFSKSTKQVFRLETLFVGFWKGFQNQKEKKEKNVFDGG